jgi:hypothetical protein
MCKTVQLTGLSKLISIINAAGACPVIRNLENSQSLTLFGAFHTDITDENRGVNDINAFFLFLLLIIGRAPLLNEKITIIILR